MKHLMILLSVTEKMNKAPRLAMVVLLVAALLALGGVPSLAQSGSPPKQSTGYDLSWWSVDGGGATSAAGSGYALGGTAGQPDAAVWSGGVYTLAGGFWGGALVEYHVYLPLVMRSTQ